LQLVEGMLSLCRIGECSHGLVLLAENAPFVLEGLEGVPEGLLLLSKRVLEGL
jgi:hypothetical protein